MSGNRYIFVDEGNYYPLHNLYYITGHTVKELKILSAILMSDIIRQQIGNITNNMNGGFPRWQSQYLRKLKIPNLWDLEIEISNQLIKCYTLRDYDTLNIVVGELYNYHSKVTKSNKQIQKQLLAPKRHKQEKELVLDFSVL
jgi:hypothetical protein